jgi:hypothetical protein
MLGRALVARIPKPVILKLDDSSLAVLTFWVGPLTLEDLKGELRRRLRWTVPIGLLFVLGSIPLPGDPAAGVAGVPFDPVSLVLGLGLIALSVAARIVPHPFLLALDGLWFLLLAADTVWGVVRGGDSVWWLALAAFLVLAGLQPLAAYRRFSASPART